MKTTELTVAGHKYQIGALNAMQQFHVSRRIAPLLATMGISFASVLKGRSLSVEEILPSLAPVSQVLSSMSDEQTDYIFATCLSVVKRAELSGSKEMWAPVASGALMQYQDIDMLAMIRLVIAVLQVNLEDFFKELLAQAESSGSSQDAPPAA